MSEKITITPEKAVGFFDGLVGKHQGTRDDFRVLDTCVQVLNNVVREWRLYREAYGPVETAPPQSPPAAVGEPEPKNGTAVDPLAKALGATKPDAPDQEGEEGSQETVQ